MPVKRLENVTWQQDTIASEKGEPCTSHSFVAALATALHTMGAPIDFAWLNGVSGFAFRTWVHEDLCPSAMSMFDWDQLLPEAVAQAGFDCTYVSRMWHESEVEAERRAEAHAQIVAGIGRGAPAIVWDIGIPEWGVIFGYDDVIGNYDTLSVFGQTGTLPYSQLGRREIRILSVMVPGARNNRTRDEIIRNALQVALRHVDGQEWMDRPQYEDGPRALTYWARALDPDEKRAVNWEFSEYYASLFAAGRCYARDFLASIADGDETLLAASAAYARAAKALMTLWEAFKVDKQPADDVRRRLVDALRNAKRDEEKAIRQVRAYVERQPVPN
jgi:hypothetical protein